MNEDLRNCGCGCNDNVGANTGNSCCDSKFLFFILIFILLFLDR